MPELCSFRSTAGRLLALMGLLALGVLAGCEPMGPIPGKSIDGVLADAPDDWRALDSAEVVQLETAGNYSVNIWGVGTVDGYFVAASRGPKTRWAKRIGKDPSVRLRVGDSVYALTASEVSDRAVRERVAAAYNKKYDFDADDDFPDAVIYRLDRL